MPQYARFAAVYGRAEIGRAPPYQGPEVVRMDYDIWKIAEQSDNWGKPGFDDYVDAWDSYATEGEDLSQEAFEEYLGRFVAEDEDEETSL